LQTTEIKRFPDRRFWHGGYDKANAGSVAAQVVLHFRSRRCEATRRGFTGLPYFPVFTGLFCLPVKTNDAYDPRKVALSLEATVGSILTIASAKGGCGKSALTAVLAVNLAARGYKVAVVDADPNEGISSWHRDAYEGPPLTVSAESRHLEIVDRVQALAEDHDVTFVDTAGFSNQCSAMAMGTADLVLIPVLPDRQSVIEGMRTARHVENFAKAARREIPYRVVLSRWTPKGLVERALLADLASASMPIIGQHLSDLSDYRKFTVSGAVPTAGKMAEQVQAILGELVAQAALPPPPRVRLRKVA
jgi:chromosome partitioning protein